MQKLSNVWRRTEPWIPKKRRNAKETSHGKVTQTNHGEREQECRSL